MPQNVTTGGIAKASGLDDGFLACGRGVVEGLNHRQRQSLW